MSNSILIKTIALAILSVSIARAAPTPASTLVPRQDMVWTSTDADFFKGAFLGDGIQGAMVMQDTVDRDGIRFLMGHYKAITDQGGSRVLVGNMVIQPVGKASSQTMRMDLWNGETNGRITTDAGSVTWRALADRKHGTFVVVTEATSGESGARLFIRPEWGINTAIYRKNQTPDESKVAPKPTTTKEGNIDLVLNPMRNKGGHVIASRTIVDGNRKILFCAIGVDNNANRDSAVAISKRDAIARINAAVAEGEAAVTTRHRLWWNEQMGRTTLELPEDPYWEKFWWTQRYKFASGSSETSAFVFDTQGPWSWFTDWGGVWWNLNVQLSYYPMYSGNQLDVGSSLVRAMDRIYASGALRKNTWWSSPGITLGRSGDWSGEAGWGDEYGNLPWALHCYWKYWKYSGEDSIARRLFPILKDNAAYLISKLSKDAKGVYHVKPSRSPEYTDSLYNDANYAVMSVHWTMKTLLELDSLFGFADPARKTWKEVFDHLTPYPTDANGLRVSAEQGFNKGHRHYSHLLAIYPYHTLSGSQGDSQKTLVSKSIDRWMTLTTKGGAAGYSFTGGAAMYASIGDAEKAVTSLDGLKSKLTPNTMYGESRNPVIETPLSAVESINYMLLQSWDGAIRIFPATPARWKNVHFRQFRTEGAFLVSASRENGETKDGIVVLSEKGMPCVVDNPWPGKQLHVVGRNGRAIATIRKGERHSFPTIPGEEYLLTTKAPQEGSQSIVDIALDRPVAASSSCLGNEAGNVVSSTAPAGSHWSSCLSGEGRYTGASVPQWLSIDLGEQHRSWSLDSWKVASVNDGDGAVSAMQLQSSGDGDVWRTMDSVSGNRSRILQRSLGGIEAPRHVRIHITQASSNWDPRIKISRFELPAVQTARLYSNTEYSGVSIGLTEGRYSRQDLLARGHADNSLSSLAVPRGWRVELYDEDGFSKPLGNFQADVASLVPTGWNDRATSLVVSASGSVATTRKTIEGIRIARGVVWIPGVSNGELLERDLSGRILARHPIQDGRASLSHHGSGMRILQLDAPEAKGLLLRVVSP